MDELIAKCRQRHAEHSAALAASEERRSHATFARKLAAKHEARDYFASLQGWRVTPKAFNLRNLRHGHRGLKMDEFPGGWYKGDGGGVLHKLLDHAEYFRRGRRPVAIVGHPYVDPEDALVCAAEQQLAAEVLPASWYYPDNTIAVLIVAPEPTPAWLGDSPLGAADQTLYPRFENRSP